MKEYNFYQKPAGYLVDGKYHGTKFAQALGRARFIASEHKRSIDVTFRDALGLEDVKLTVIYDRRTQSVRA